MTKTSIDVSKNERNDVLEAFNPAISKFLAQLSQKVQNSIKPQLKGLASDGQKFTSMNPSTKGEKKGSSSSWEFDVEKQLQAWRENPSWTDKPPQIKVLNIRIKGRAFHCRPDVHSCCELGVIN